VQGSLTALQTKVGDLKEQVTKVSTKLDDFYDLAKRKLVGLGKLPLQEFGRALGDVQDAIGVATVLKVHAPDEALESFKKNFLALNGNEAGYWSALSQFINFQSAQVALPEGVVSLKVPRCDDVGAIAERAYGPYRWRRCLIDLDQPLGDSMRHILEFGTSTPVRFKCQECLVKYGGGSIDPLLSNAVFINCFFSLSIQSQPSAIGKRLSRAILQSASVVDLSG
jgi:hypothetical protein